ncbi:MAG: TerB family tellurite resistance protein [Pseudomonadota bacterium]
MSLAKLSNVLKIFRGEEATKEECEECFKEALLMTLARATSADSNIASVEVTKVAALLEKRTGEAVTEADIRVAANSELYETAPLDKYLSGITARLSQRQRAIIANSLADIIRSDEGVREAEIDYFNRVAKALNLSHAEVAGLISDSP